MPIWRHGTVLKRWRYLGVYTRELMLCVGDARIGPFPRRWWAVATPDGQLHGHSSVRPGGLRLEDCRVTVATPLVQIDIELGDAEEVQTASPTEQGGYIWTSKRAGVSARGAVVIAGRRFGMDGPHAFIDHSAGYHARHTAWKWSAGLGRLADGRAVGWNLVAGVHDDPVASERTVWVDGRPEHAAEVSFAADLSSISFAAGGHLRFREWCTREERVNLLLVRSFYRQPFGTFSGQLPGALELDTGYGVMEEHDVWW
jgi:hypothetical protein